MTSRESTSREATRAAIRAVLAADCACPPAAFDDDQILVIPAAERPGRRHFPLPARQVLVVTMGHGVVVSCDAGWVAPLRAMLADRARDAIFGANTIAELAHFVAGTGEEIRGPAVSYACDPGAFRLPGGPPGLSFDVLEGEAVRDLYRHPGFGHALSYDPHHPRPDVAAAVARREGRIVGIAGMSADCEALWQIGIDVIAEERGAGIGRALVGRLTALALERGRVPYYTHDLANLRSHALAVSLGYWPAWVEMYAREP